MANKYISAYMQLVWAVKFRRALITAELRPHVERMIRSFLVKYKHEVIAIYCMPDHIHILFGYHPAQSVSTIVQIAKTESCKLVKRLTGEDDMDWQDGYGLITYGAEAVPTVKAYVENQAAHHARDESFVEEFERMLTERGQVFDRKYFFHEPLD